MHRGPFVPAIVIAACAGAWASEPGRTADGAQAKPSRIVERATAHLAQLDVTVTGPEAVTRSLEAADFDVVVQGRTITDPILDVACGSRTVPAQDLKSGNASSAAPEPEARPATIVFYFDQPHLTLGGRQRSIDVARELVKRLIGHGSRAAVVSSSQRLETFADLTDDPARLLAALDALEKSGSQWDTSSQYEQESLDEFEGMIEEERVTRGVSKRPLGGEEVASRIISTAMRLHQEELWRAERDLRTLSLAVGRLAEADPPKAFVYFADTMRKNAGEHYFKFFSQSATARRFVTGRAAARQSSSDETSFMTSAGRAFAADRAFARVVDEAAARGVRFYTVQAEGLVPSSIRASDAKDTLSSLASETGGKAFLNGISGTRIATAMARDFGCMVLLSFDPAGLPEDEPLSVTVGVRKPGVRVQVRDRLVVQSASARLTSRLLSAFVAPGTREDGSLRVHVIPTGFDDGRFTALVQVVAAGRPDGAATWDLGASVISHRKVRQDTSGRIATGSIGTPVVLEKELQFGAGAYEIVAVGHDVESDRVVSTRTAGTWPDPQATDAAAGPIALVRGTTGAFSRDERVRTRGSVGVEEDEATQSGSAVAFVSVACRGASAGGRVQVERALLGEQTVRFEPVALPFDGEPCALVRDIVPEGTLTGGSYRYDLTIGGDQKESVRGRRSFVVSAASLARTRRDRARVEQGLEMTLIREGLAEGGDTEVP